MHFTMMVMTDRISRSRDYQTFSASAIKRREIELRSVDINNLSTMALQVSVY